VSDAPLSVSYVVPGLAVCWIVVDATRSLEEEPVSCDDVPYGCYRDPGKVFSSTVTHPGGA